MLYRMKSKSPGTQYLTSQQIWGICPAVYRFPLLNQVGDDWSGSVQFSHSIMSDSLRPHGLQHARIISYYLLGGRRDLEDQTVQSLGLFGNPHYRNVLFTHH